MNPDGYWCPMCGDVPTMSAPKNGMILVRHRADCIGFHAIPRYKPLDVPEVTTLDESDLADGMVVVCVDNVMGHTTITTPDGRLLIDGYVWADRLCQIWLDDVESIQYVAGTGRLNVT